MRALACALLTACSGGPTALPTAPAEPGLSGTRWQLQQLTSMSDEVPPARPASAGQYTLAFEADGRLLLRLDCNRGTGRWQAQAAPASNAQRRSGSLQLGPLATTRAACPPGSLESRLLRELPAVRSFVIEGGRLHLALMADGGIQTWAPLP